MRKFIGITVSTIGGKLWEKGGFWNADERYENLTVLGKLGYHLFCTGFKIMGLTMDDVQRIVNENN